MCHIGSHEKHLAQRAAPADRRLGAQGRRARRDHRDGARQAAGAPRGDPRRQAGHPVPGSPPSAGIRTPQRKARPGDRQHGDPLRGSPAQTAFVSYFDSSYIAKFYLDEPESEAVRRLAESLGQIRCAVIGQVEVAAVFHRKFREGAFAAGAFRACGRGSPSPPRSRRRRRRRSRACRGRYSCERSTRYT